MRKHFLWMGAAVAAATACGNDLQINNINNPDVARAYATPTGVEGVVGGLGVQLNNTQRASESINTQAKVLSGEQFATVANFGMAARSQIPRSPLSNDLGNDNQTGNRSNWDTFSRTGRSAATAIQGINAYQAKGLTMGSAAQDARAKAFAYMILGNALGYLSLGYDSAAIVLPTTASSEVPPLSGYKAVNTAALQMLDSAIAVATSAAASSGGSNGFPLPSTWISGQANLTAANFVRLVRSYKARIRAGVARTPAERAAVDWNAVISDATNGITADFMITLGGSTGWSATFDVNQSYVPGGWHSLALFYYGMADVSGAYDAWLATPRDSRKAFLVQTPDTRWPSGATRTAQQAGTPTVALPAGRYIRNRPSGEDVPVTGWGDSWYDHRRWGVLNIASISGPYAEMSKTEIDMLAAEGYIRQGNLAAAAALINITRLKNGLPSVGVPASATAPISSAADCVPRVPQAPNFTSTACGNILEAMKYEKRMETSFTGYLVWFADMRGWGDMITGTAVEWPVPYQEMQARYGPYHAGTNAAPKGTYGF